MGLRPGHEVDSNPPPSFAPYFDNTFQIHSISERQQLYYPGHWGTHNHCNDAHPGYYVLEKYVCHEALHDSSAYDTQLQSHPGTRERVSKMIRTWVDNPFTEPRILWLYGPPGAGKSAMAQSIVEYCRQTDTLAAVFFATSPERDTADRVIPTLTWQLVFSVPEIEEYISAALEIDPLLPTRSVEIQFEHLIVMPFEQIAKKHGEAPMSKIVVVLDGVDNLVDESTQQRFLTLIANAVDQARIPLRFLISSGSESHIQDTFDLVIPNRLICRIALDDSIGLNSHIKDYLVDEFERISSERGISGLSLYSWPSRDAVDRLVHNSAGQSIYATTVIKFVDDVDSHPMRQLDVVLGLQPYHSSPSAHLDRLYVEILRRHSDQTFIANLLAVLLVSSTGPMPVPSIGVVNALLGLGQGELFTKLHGGMNALLDVSKYTVGFCHVSFLEFLLSPARSCQYHLDEYEATRRFLALLGAALVRYASVKAGCTSDYDCANLESLVHTMAAPFPYSYQQLSLEDWEDVLHPIQEFADKPFQASDFDVFYRLHLVHQIVLRLLTFKKCS